MTFWRTGCRSLTHEPRRRPGKCPSTARRQGCQRPPGSPTTPRSPQWFPGKSIPGRGSQTLTLREGPWALHLSFQKVRDATHLPKLLGGAALSGAPRPPEPRLIRQTHRPNPQGHADPTQTHSTATQPPQGSPRPGPNLHPLHKYGRNPTVGPGKVRGWHSATATQVWSLLLSNHSADGNLPESRRPGGLTIASGLPPPARDRGGFPHQSPWDRDKTGEHLGVGPGPTLTLPLQPRNQLKPVKSCSQQHTAASL